MGFFSSLVYYRPTQPPIVRPESLLAFVQGFPDCEVTSERSALGCSLEVKFGDAIDQDDVPSMWDAPVDDSLEPTWLQRLGALLGFAPRGQSSSMLYTTDEIEWDHQEQFETLTELADEIRGLDANRNVYRVEITLGTASESVVRSLERTDSPENEIDLLLSDWRLSFGPIEIGDLGSEQRYHVGWIGLSISGDGYLFPWKLKDLVRRAEDCPQVQSAMELCRRIWPVATAPPSEERIQNRRMLDNLWPHPIDMPVEWAWGVDETG